MKTRSTVVLLLLAMLVMMGIAWAQAETDLTLAGLSAALADSRYLDAYHAALALTDSDPALVVTALAAAPETDLDHAAQIFLLLYSARAGQALDEIESLTDGATSLVAQAIAYESLGDADEVARILPLALDAAPDAAQVYGALAAAAFFYGDIGHMADYATRALEIDPDAAGLHRLHGMADSFTGDSEAALADAEQAAALDPSIYFFHYMRVGIGFALGDIDSSLAAADAGLAMQPNSFLGYAMRANVNMALGNAEQAALDFASAVESRTVEEIAGDVLVAGEPAEVSMTYGRTYRFAVDAQAGQSLSVAAASVVPDEVDMMVVLLSPDGAPLAFNDDGETTLDGAIEGFAVTEGGVYTLLITHANGGSEGAVVVALSLE